MKIEQSYRKFCKETKRGGSCLIGGSIKEAISYVISDLIEQYKADNLKNADTPFYYNEQEQYQSLLNFKEYLTQK